jgi:hypothetical protein
MRRIIRRTLLTDLLGQVLSARTEELVDDEQGTVSESNATALARCEACDRPCDGPAEHRGICTLCRRRCCIHCIGRCAICSCTMCHDCRNGFAEGKLSVCPNCLAELENRLALQDRTAAEKVAFERILTILNSELKLAEVLHQDGGGVAQFVAQMVQARILHKLIGLEKDITEEHGHGRRLLP